MQAARTIPIAPPEAPVPGAAVDNNPTRLIALFFALALLYFYFSSLHQFLPVNIYELGLIYDVKVEESGEVNIKMTLTAPNCPAAQSLPAEVKYKAEAVPGVIAANVEIVWEPPWDMTKMTEAARLQLGMI